MNIDIRQRLERKGRAGLMLRSPFFGVLAFDCKLVEDKSIPTMAVTPDDELIYNPEFVRALPDECVPTAVAHEVLHLAFDVFGARGNRDPHRWNVADDHANNNLLVESGFKLGEGWLCDSKYRGWSRERIYDDLAENPPKEPKGDKDGEGEGMGRPGGCADHNHPKAVQGTAQASAMRAKWARRIASAAQAARSAGTLSAGIEQKVGEVLNPKLPWTRILERFLAHAASEPEDSTLSLPGRRQSALGRPCASELPRPEPVVVFFDTSGSMNGLLERCIGEAQGVLRRWPGLPLRVLCGDMEVSADFRAASVDEIKAKMKGGGGTDFRAVFEQLRRDCCRALVGFSDLEATFPEQRPGFPVLWVAPEKAPAPPFGRIVTMA